LRGEGGPEGRVVVEADVLLVVVVEVLVVAAVVEVVLEGAVVVVSAPSDPLQAARTRAAARRGKSRERLIGRER